MLVIESTLPMLRWLDALHFLSSERQARLHQRAGVPPGARWPALAAAGERFWRGFLGRERGARADSRAATESGVNALLAAMDPADVGPLLDWVDDRYLNDARDVLSHRWSRVLSNVRRPNCPYPIASLAVTASLRERLERALAAERVARQEDNRLIKEVELSPLTPLEELMVRADPELFESLDVSLRGLLLIERLCRVWRAIART